MLKLILKDFLIQKNLFLKYIVLFSVISIVATSDLEFKNATLIMGAVSIAYILITTAFAIDDREKSQIIINCLPVTKKDIVLSKYLSILLFGFIGIAVTSIVLIPFDIFNIFGVELKLNLANVRVVFTYLILFFSINFPIYFKIGYINASKFNILMYLGIFFASYFAIANVSSKPVRFVMNFINSRNQMTVMLCGTILIIILLLLSIFLSIRFYERRNI